MKQKALIVWLLSLFVWNTVFGAFGGLLLCLHEDLSLHVDTDLVTEASCADHCSEPAFEASCLSESESCVDIELSGQLLPPARIDEQINTLMLLPQHTLALPVSVNEQPAMERVICLISSRGPPECLATSVQVARVIQLRV